MPRVRSPRQHDPVAHLKLLRSSADFDDDAHGLVTHHPGWLGESEKAAIGVEVRAADGGRGDAHDDVFGEFDGGLGDVADGDLEGLAFPDHGAHSFPGL